VASSPTFIYAILCGLGLLAVCFGCIAYQSRRSEPSWKDDELPNPIARRCLKLFRSYGIEASATGDVTSFDMLIPGAQVPQKPGAIAIFCRSRNFLVGETLFSRIHERSLQLAGWTVMLVVTTPITRELTYLGKAHNIAVLDMTEIHSFAAALKALKMGHTQIYPGRSHLIKQFLTQKFHRSAA
jgi:hypothetical protein